VDLSGPIDAYLKSVAAGDGILHIFVPHTTAAVTINENADPDVRSDIKRFLMERVPHDWGFQHAEGNSDAHILSSLIGVSLSIFVSNGMPVLGTWQSVFFGEFDGPRRRQVLLKFVPDKA